MPYDFPHCLKVKKLADWLDDYITGLVKNKQSIPQELNDILVELYNTANKYGRIP